jgi:hypothetical protein
MVIVKPLEFYKWWNRNNPSSVWLPFTPLSKGLNKTTWSYNNEEIVTCPYADDMKISECCTCKDRFICFTIRWDSLE